MPKHIELTEEQRKTLGQRIVDLWRDDNLDRDDWLGKLPVWLDAYQGRPTEKNTPWEGASNFHVPITRTHIEAIHPRLMAALHQPEPIVSVRGQEPSDDDRARKTEKFLDYVVREEVPLFNVEDRAILGAATNGIQFVKVTWDLKTRHLRTVHEFPADMLPNDVIAAVVKGEQQFTEALQRVGGEEATQALADLQKEREIVLEVKVGPTSLIVTTEREEVIKDCPRLDLVDAEDIVVNSDASHDLQEVDHLIHRYWLTMDEVRRKVKTGTFQLTDDQLDELESLATGMVDTHDDNTVNIKQVREDVTGANVVWRVAEEPSRLQVLDAYLGEDINDDGLEEQLVVTTFHGKPDCIARAVRREDLFRHGLLPYVVFAFYPVSNSFWATGIPQMLEGIQLELNVIHNQRNDAGSIGNTPYGWYVPAAGFNPEPMKIQPGYLLPVDDVNRVKMAQPGNYTAWGIQEEAGLLAMAEKLTKVNDLTLGRIGESQGAARTASGVQALASQQASGFDILIRRMQEGHKRLLQLILANYAQYMPPGREVRILGKYANDPETIVTRDDLRGQMDLRFTGNSLNTDREIERQAYTYLAGGPMNPQVLQGLLQFGITDPPGIASWYRHLLKAFDVPGLDRIIKMPEMRPVQTPESIINQTIDGVRVPVNPGEDHQAVIQGLVTILNGPDAIGLAPESIVVMQEQVSRRQQQMQVDLQVQQAQQMMAMMQGPPPGMGGPPGAPPGPGGGGPLGAPVPPPQGPPGSPLQHLSPNPPAAGPPPPRPAVFGA